ncbi:MAG: SemiSWEET family sugar transporter [Kofleriaceae bacterium]
MILVIGLCAAALTVTSFVAQAHKILKTRDASSLSTKMWILSTTAFAIWIVYGVLLGDWPIILPNVVCCILAGFILSLKLMSPRKRDAVADKMTSADRPPSH